MRLLAVIVATLVLGACGAKTTTPSATTTTPTTTTTPGAAAALDCAKPANAAQQLVCGDPHLTDLDHRLQASYQQALARPGADHR
ncbi:MAG: lysozyme inhibitor LprI family protein, partial [Mycobacterium sp.]